MSVLRRTFVFDENSEYHHVIYWKLSFSGPHEPFQLQLSMPLNPGSKKEAVGKLTGPVSADLSGGGFTIAQEFAYGFPDWIEADIPGLGEVRFEQTGSSSTLWASRYLRPGRVETADFSFTWKPASAQTALDIFDAEDNLVAVCRRRQKHELHIECDFVIDWHHVPEGDSEQLVVLLAASLATNLLVSWAPPPAAVLEANGATSLYRIKGESRWQVEDIVRPLTVQVKRDPFWKGRNRKTHLIFRQREVVTTLDISGGRAEGSLPDGSSVKFENSGTLNREQLVDLYNGFAEIGQERFEWVPAEKSAELILRDSRRNIIHYARVPWRDSEAGLRWIIDWKFIPEDPNERLVALLAPAVASVICAK